jgi:hypothetical protein
VSVCTIFAALDPVTTSFFAPIGSHDCGKTWALNEGGARHHLLPRCRVPKLGYPKPTTKRSKPSPEKPRQCSARAGTTSQNHIRMKTGHPRLRSDSHEARSTGCLDSREISDSHDPRSSRSTLPHPPTYRQKSRHLMQPPTTSHPRSYNTASMKAVPVSNPAFYCPSRDGR